MGDHLFPRYHVRPPAGYVNDPNGPILVGGLAHLYFQHRHDLDHDSPVHWGHVTSPDLVHWDYHRPAIAPHPSLADRDGCWSGNTVVDAAGVLRAFYSGHVAGARLQKTLSAVTADGGYSYGMPRQVVPDPSAGEAIDELRDPFVWREGSSWRMVLGAGTSTGTAMLRLYASEDLDSWEYRGPLASLVRTRAEEWDSGAMWECPQVLSIAGALIAVVGSWGPQEGIMKVLSFAVPDAATGPQIEPSALHLVDHGPNFYAASVITQGVAEPIMWGWVTEGRSEDWCQADDWSGMLSLPRAVSLRPDGALASSPLPAMTSLRVAEPGREVPGRLDGLGAQFEFRWELPEQTAQAHVLRIRFGEHEHLEITCDGETGDVTIDRDRASSDPRAHAGRVVVRDRDVAASREQVVRGFVDGSVLELFLPGGRVATTRVYPTSPPPWRIELVDEPAAGRLWVWELKA